MRRISQSIIKIIFSLVIGGLILAYIFFNTRLFIQGPDIFIHSPTTGETVTESLIEIEGKAINVTYVSINDRPITIDDAGNFEEEILLQDGYNIIMIEAKDKFNRQVTKQLELVYNEYPEK